MTTRFRPTRALAPEGAVEGWAEAVIGSASSAIIATDLDGTIRMVNPATEQLYGWAADELLGRNVVDVLVPESLQDDARSIMADLRAKGHWTGTFSVRCKDGTSVTALITNRPVLDGDGTVIGIVGESHIDHHEETDRVDLARSIPADSGATLADAARVATEIADARLAGLQAVTSALSRALHRSEVADAVFDHGLRQLGGHTGSLCLLAADGTTVDLAHSMGYSTAVTDVWGSFPLDANLPASEAIRTGEMVLLRSAAERDERFPMPRGAPLVGDQAHAIIPLRDEDGTVFGCLVVGFAAPRTFEQADVRLLVALGAQCSGALRRAELFEATKAAVDAEQTARRAAEEAREGLAFLAEASSALASSLDFERTLARVVDLAVPRLADWCAVFVPTEDGGGIHSIALAHADDDRLALVRCLLDRYPPDPHAPSGVAAVIRTGRAELTREIDDALLERVIADPEHRALVREVGLGSTAVLPLQAAGRVLGALVLATDRGRPLPDTSLTLGVDLAVRAGVAIDNALLFAERTRIARQLQATLLPAGLPAIPGLDVGARYAAASESEEVGGDFYDVFPLDDGRWVVVVGDVRGKGVEAAAVTGLTRHTIRSASLHLDSPAALLSHLNEILLRSEADRAPFSPDGGDESDDAWARDEPRFCTVGLAVVTPAATAGPEGPWQGADVTVCVAGHPLPLVARADGNVEAVGRPGSLLGVSREVELHEVTVHLDPGDTLVSFTDGIVERHEGDRFFESDGVAAVLRATGGLTADAVAAAIERAARRFVAGTPRDDMAVVVVRVPRLRA